MYITIIPLKFVEINYSKDDVNSEFLWVAYCPVTSYLCKPRLQHKVHRRVPSQHCFFFFSFCLSICFFLLKFHVKHYTVMQINFTIDQCERKFFPWKYPPLLGRDVFPWKYFSHPENSSKFHQLSTNTTECLSVWSVQAILDMHRICESWTHCLPSCGWVIKGEGKCRPRRFLPGLPASLYCQPAWFVSIPELWIGRLCSSYKGANMVCPDTLSPWSSLCIFFCSTLVY